MNETNQFSTMNHNMKQNLISNGWDPQQQLAKNLTGYNVPSPALSKPLVDVLSKAHEGIYDYPLSFTQGIVPVCKNSHSKLQLAKPNIETDLFS
jgi:hypothetical protein